MQTLWHPRTSRPHRPHCLSCPRRLLLHERQDPSGSNPEGRRGTILLLSLTGKVEVLCPSSQEDVFTLDTDITDLYKPWTILFSFPVVIGLQWSIFGRFRGIRKPRLSFGKIHLGPKKGISFFRDRGAWGGEGGRDSGRTGPFSRNSRPLCYPETYDSLECRSLSSRSR